MALLLGITVVAACINLLLRWHRSCYLGSRTAVDVTRQIRYDDLF